MCKIELANHRMASDNRGKVTFSNFTIRRGPEGIYGFRVEVAQSKMKNSPKSDIFYARFQSEIGKIRVLNSECKEGVGI